MEHIIVIGGGFSGINLAKELANTRYKVTIFDKHNYHTFQPLLYQVATAGLEPDSIAYPLRRIFKKYKNIHFRMAEVKNVDHSHNRINTSAGVFHYDYLVIASGSKPNYFNLEKKKEKLLTLKYVPDALNIRSWILQNFEEAVFSDTSGRKKTLLDVAIIGAGPTGVELAGAIGEMKKYVLPTDYPELDFSMMSIRIYEMMEKVLPAMSDHASKKSFEYLQKLGVKVELNTKVTDYDGEKLSFEGKESFPTETVIWTAGVSSNPVEGLPEESMMKGNRLQVDTHLKVKGMENIYAMGDVAGMKSEDLPKGHPMLAAVAIQQGEYLGKYFKKRKASNQYKGFRYKDKGTMATVGRNKAVADLNKSKISGFTAWIAWLFVHLFYLIGFRNKISVFSSWFYNYFTYDKALRLIIRPYKKN